MDRLKQLTIDQIDTMRMQFEDGEYSLQDALILCDMAEASLRPGVEQAVGDGK